MVGIWTYFSKLCHGKCPCFADPLPEKRTVYVDNKYPPGVEVEVPVKYPSNRIISSRYTAWNIIPKNLFEQFHRIANFYFLCVAFVELLIDSPVSPWTSIVPLIFVVVVTFGKQAYEDWLRHKSDREVNDRPAVVVREGQEVKVTASDIHVGDVVRVVANEEIPCDMVMLSSEDPEGGCYITTANLDGETNLKTFTCVSNTKFLQTESFQSFRASIECEQPTTDLYKFVGRIHLHMAEQSSSLFYQNANNIARPASVVNSYESSLHKSADNLIPSTDNGSTSSPVIVKPLSADNLLLRGSRLKNTQYVFGCAVYTGQDTKISQNSKFKSHKYSRVEKKMNTFLLIFLGALALYSAIWVGLKFAFYEDEAHSEEKMWYVEAEPEMSALVAIEEFLAFMILCNYVIPISMYVTVELQKFFGSMFFGWDVEMYDAQLNEPAKANTSDLNEELGQVEYLFSDKTGTLTENLMEFRLCSVKSVKYIEVGGVLCHQPDVEGVSPTPVQKITDDVSHFLRVLALCHSLHVDKPADFTCGTYSDTGREYDYQASSPDEKALVEACRRYGVIYHGTRDEAREVSFHGDMKRYQLHHTLEFDPVRKRMSVIIQDEDDRYWLLCKGAETSVLERISEGDVVTVETHINDFAVLGLRTLVIAQRELTSAEFKEFDTMLHAARKSLENREGKLQTVYDQVERKMTLLGATAVEDRLQDGVPETISALREAGIQVWVLTGDKEETAVNISYSAGHFNHSMEPISVTKQKSSNECGQTLSQFRAVVQEHVNTGASKKHALVIDGMSIAFALQDHADLLRDLCEGCVTVLCCRMSPIQKARVVKLMKESKNDPTTAAIGDGANDVSMIQEAHIGLGIMGKEGRQAVRASDYAFGRFKFVRRALLVHGHYFYVRMAMLVQYFFFKNVAMIMAQLYFTFYSAYSAQTIFESYFLTVYNVTFTTLPILIYGIFEISVSSEILLKYPSLYLAIRRNARMSNSQFLLWNILGLWHSLVYFFGVYFAFSSGNSPFENGKQIGVYDYGSIIMTACVFGVNAKLMLETYHWNAIVFFGFALTLVGYFVTGFFYSAFTWDFISYEFSYYHSFENVLNSVYIWFLIFVLTMIAIIPDIIIRGLRDNFSVLYAHVPSNKVNGDETHSVTSSTMLVEKYTSNCYDNPAYNVYLEGPGYEGIALQEVKNSPSYANPLIQATYM